MTYAEKLKDPRWQRKRLEVMEAARFECENCGEDGEELQIHHPAYRKGVEPWEYETKELSCLCATCHRKATKAAASWREMALADKSGFYSLMQLVTDGVIDEACSRLIEIMSKAEDENRLKVGFSCDVSMVASDLFAAINKQPGKPVAGGDIPHKGSTCRPAFEQMLAAWRARL